MAIVVSRLMKDSDSEVTEMLAEMDYTQKEDMKQLILEESKSLKEKERLQATVPQYIQPNKSLVILCFIIETISEQSQKRI